jgi:peptidoglycan/LPS O-acetylase OafA/YrhL
VKHDDYLALRRFESLDGLRAISVLLVIWHHTAAGAFAGTPLEYVGSRGVTLFFAISGFLITTLLLRERDRHGSIDLRAFYMRRSLRIFPVFYVTLAAYVVLVWSLERGSDAGREFFRNLPYFATYTSNWFVELKERTIFYFAWSLATEEQYYLAWPPLLVALGTRRRALAFMAVATAAVIAFQAWLGTFADARTQNDWHQRVPLAIVAGSLLAIVLHGPAGYRNAARWLGHPLASGALTLGLACAMSLPGIPEHATHILGVLLVASVCMQPAHVTRGVLAWRPLAYLGTISYGMYLLHMLSHHAATKLLAKLGIQPGWMLGYVATVAATTLVAGASFRWFESPLLRIKRRYER